MRLTSTIFVSAHIRRCFSEGAHALVMRRGEADAGAIFLMVDRLDGTVDLYGPAPQTAFDEERPATRLFNLTKERCSPAAADSSLDQEARFDPDIWVLVVEDKAGRSFLDLTTEP